MRPLRAAALVMLIIAALDGVIDVIEHLTKSDLWQVLLATGLIVFVADLLVDRRTILGKWAYAGCEWLSDRVRYAIQWTIATSVGGGTVRPAKKAEEAKTAEPSEPAAAKTPTPADQPLPTEDEQLR